MAVSDIFEGPKRHVPEQLDPPAASHFCPTGCQSEGEVTPAKKHGARQ